ncbi:hypothetical protein [Dyella sp.]|jgi:septal ring factor EnvC (AmiA/AmiB activator)|uniref:hypothetical protein n=1 Tax=Dyella sp. TaxID=1869338 RepID=UPI002D76BB4E|nr:hypothetical protein [Dyella sp.]HET6432611.1 hypothetical protein [Dyella sp.]
MRCTFLVALLTVAQAGGAPALAAASRGQDAAATTQADPQRIGLHLKRTASEVQQLQQAVAAQESRSRQAQERLREQDRALEQLRQQLQATHPAPPSGKDGS